MSLSDQRMTTLEIINEVRRKVKLNPVSTLDEDSASVAQLAYLNDVVSEVDDYGDWQETLAEVLVTVQSSVQTYEINVSAIPVIHNIHEVACTWQPAELRMVDLDTIRRMERVRSFGYPTMWSVKGVDTNGNPKFTISPIPTSVVATSGAAFNVLVYSKPPFITTAQATLVPPFPGKLLVQGLKCKWILDESDGEPTARYGAEKQVYDAMLDESFNRYNGDSGSTIFFRPARGRR